MQDKKREKLDTWFYRVPGKRSPYYYQCIFTDWQGIKRNFALGEDEKSARYKLGELRKKNNAEFDFGSPARQKRKEEKRRQQEAERKGLTLGEWARRYFDTIAPTLDKRPRTIEREHWNRLEAHFGSMALADIKLTAIATYRVAREREVSFVTCNRELGFVRYLLSLGLEDGVLEAAPRIRLKNEQSTVRTRTLAPEEYAAVMGHMQREQQRYHIALYETAMRLREPLKVYLV